MLLGIFEEGDQGSVFEFGGDVVEGDAAVFEVGFVGIGFGVAGDAAEVVEMLTPFLGEGEVGLGVDGFAGFEGGEVGPEVGGSLGSFGFGVIDHGGHGGGGFEEVGLGDPAGEPGFVGAVADVGEVGTGVFELGHGGLAEVGGVALDAVVAGEEVSGVEGGFVRRYEGGGGDGFAGEFAAFFPEKAEGAGSVFEGGEGDFDRGFSGVEAEAF